MSVFTKKKYVNKEVLEDFSMPKDSEIIVQVKNVRGNNLHEVEQADGLRYLVSMPPKFRKTIWLMRGSYLMVTPIAEGKKVKAEITRVLYPRQIGYIEAEGLWPFCNPRQRPAAAVVAKAEEEGDSDNEDFKGEVFHSLNKLMLSQSTAQLARRQILRRR